MRLVAVTLTSAFTSLSAAVPIAENGEARAVIVHNGNDGVPQDFQRAREHSAGLIPSSVDALQSYLQKMTGAELPIVADLAAAGNRPAIVLELVDPLPGASADFKGDDAYHLQTEGNRLFLRARTERGLSNAVFGLLEDHLGCGFYTVKIERAAQGAAFYRGTRHEVVPEVRHLVLPNIDDFQEPSFANRGLIFKMGTYPWLVQNRGVGTYGNNVSAALNSQHNLYGLLPPEDIVRGGEVVAKGLFKDHPEIYPMNLHGEREPDAWNMSIDGTAEALPRLLAAALTKGVPEDFDGFVFAGQGDGFAACYSPESRALVREQESEAAPYVLAFNRTLDIIGETHPNLKLMTFIYFGTLDAPKTLKPHPNLWLNVVSSSVSANHAGDQMGPIAGNPANREYERSIREWSRIADGRVTTWHWDTYRSEWPSMFYVAENVRLMHEAGVFGVNPQTCGGPWTDLLNWLYVKMAWNVDADADALIRRYLEDVFSEAAAPHLWEYLKIGQQAYEDSLHIPSAVRWSGWTRITMQKIFHEAVREKMLAAMDRAEAAVRAEGTEAQLANFLQKRLDSLDALMLEAARELGSRSWGFVRDPATGLEWYVPGKETSLPALLQRGRSLQPHRRGLSQYARESGGPAMDLSHAGVAARIVPELSGGIMSLRAGTDGREILATGTSAGGYEDFFPQFHPWDQRVWLPEGYDANDAEPLDVWPSYRPTDATGLSTVLDLGGDRRLHRSVQILEDGSVQVMRAYTGGLFARLNRFDTRWRLALPEPGLATVSVNGGGIRQFLDLRYAEPGGIRFVQAGQRPPGYEGLDAMDEQWDAVFAVSDADVSTFEVTEQDGQITISLNRGDGVAVEILVEAAGLSAVEIRPLVGEHVLEVTLVAQELEAPEGGFKDLVLPAQSIVTRTVAPGEAIADAGQETATVSEPRIRITGENRAINEADGAELIWIPAGTFTRGSETGVAGSDEGPVRDIHLDGYWIYKYPVTVAQYRAFAEATGAEIPMMWGHKIWHQADPEGDHEAAAYFCNWFAAEAYAAWATGALPTEAQWEKAARGTDAREYPWGNEWDPDKLSSMENGLYVLESHTGAFHSVGSFPEGASPYGVMDMAGGQWEWVRDWYRHRYYEEAPTRNPLGPEFSNVKSVRGGSALWDERFSRTTARMALPPEVSDWTPTGFRLVIEAPGPDAE